jgi:linearmycin/streptolysin S transport system ATP-binding protein
MITIRDLVVRFGDLRAVDGLSLEIIEGSLTGLLGPNGAGKTTTLSCVAGLLKPTEGQVLVGGVDVTDDPLRVKEMLGVVPQSLALYPTLDVIANLRIFGGLFGVRGRRLQERVDWGLELARLEGRRKAIVGTLSGGMKRRLNLACALLHDPKIIVCDEPTTGVDPQSRNHLFQTIRRLHREGRTVIYTTHYMEEVEALCDRVAIMDHGKLVANDTLDALLQGSGAATTFRVQLEEGSSREAMEAALIGRGLKVKRLEAERGNLEQVFLGLTGHALRDGDEAEVPPAPAGEVGP